MHKTTLGQWQYKISPTLLPTLLLLLPFLSAPSATAILRLQVIHDPLDAHDGHQGKLGGK
jgi:hypothetical protein